MKHIHILGICGTFMGSLAILAKQLGYQVSGCDQNIYPPMSSQLQQQGIDLFQGYHVQAELPPVDEWVVGNAMKRGMPIIEHLLDNKIPLTSGPEFLAKHVLKNKKIIAVSGTHGKTTTSSMVTWILEACAKQPGYLIGGVPKNFTASANLGHGEYFVVEADEYDTAFFDKRSKFIHYQPDILIMNNIEFDHADIFRDLQTIQQQFHHLVRIIPQSGHIIYNQNDQNICQVLDQGCWTPCSSFGLKHADFDATRIGELNWSLLGEHNLLNAYAAIAAVSKIGIPIEEAKAALSKFKGVKRRLELKAERNGIKVYDDFAHHPTAIEKTIGAMKKQCQGKLHVIVDVGSNTMTRGEHEQTLGKAVFQADTVYFHHAKALNWSLETVWQETTKAGGVFQSENELVNQLKTSLNPQDIVLVLSNTGFGPRVHLLLDKMLSDEVATSN